jgi:hypothetical protein
MVESSICPSIIVTIGKQTRLYHAFVTSAPCRVDPPSTMTLYAATLGDVAAFAADPIEPSVMRARTRARLVLVDATELGWQRARCREAQHVLVPADGGLVSLNTLQHWLWQRLRTPVADEDS